MNKKKNIAGYIKLLKNFPLGKKSRRRKPHLRARHIENKKVFFNIFIQKILSEKYSNNDVLRRLEIVPLLSKIFLLQKPQYISHERKYIFITPQWKIIIIKKKESLHLLSIYPL